MDHIILVKCKPNLSQTEIDSQFKKAASLLCKIPGVLSVSAGASSNLNFSAALIVRLKANMLKVYQEHTLNKTVSKILVPLLAGETNASKRQNMSVVDIISPRYENKTLTEEKKSSKSSFGLTLLGLTTFAVVFGAWIYKKK